MNKTQRTVLAAALAAATLLLAMPPGGPSYRWEPVWIRGVLATDWTRLGLELALVAAAGGAAFVWAGRRD